uniref:Uncharacterized protein n=1 Tax=Rhizophora mucronata TaxID=61149 RepID=A0A2P2NWC9_RHIMU
MNLLPPAYGMVDNSFIHSEKENEIT